MNRRPGCFGSFVALVLLSTALHAAPPKPALTEGMPPTPTTVDADDAERLGALTMALSAVWIGAAIDTAAGVPVTGMLGDIWPDVDDDRDVDAEVALLRRWYLAAPASSDALARHPHVARVCLTDAPGEARATVYAYGDKSVAAIDSVLSPAAVVRGRVVPLAAPHLEQQPLVGSVDKTIAALTKNKRCLRLQHENGAVHVAPDPLATSTQPRERGQLRFACSDAASIISAASRFVDLLSARSRDAVYALPLALPSKAVTSSTTTDVATRPLEAMQILGRWLPAAGADIAGIAARHSSGATLVVTQTQGGRRRAATVELQAGEAATLVTLAIADDRCSLAAMPMPWQPHTTGRAVVDDDRGSTAWRSVDEAWVPTMRVPRVDAGENEVAAAMTSALPHVIGRLDPEGIRRIVRQHAGQLRYCYESTLQREPDLAGMLTMTWVIGSDGTVLQAAVIDGELHNADIDACLVARIKTWVFPVPKGLGNVVVNYPIVFRRPP